MAESEDFIPINKAIGEPVRFGPIPAAQLVPVAGILGGSVLVLNAFFGVGLVPCFLLSAWSISTWWCLTGEKPWRFTNRLWFNDPPPWEREFIPPEPLLQENKEDGSERL